MTRLLLRGVALTSALALLSNCAGEEMAPYGRLTSLRVLAIQSTPVAPAPGETTTLTPLLYVPRGHSDPKFSWSWCPFPGSARDGYPCDPPQEALSEIASLDPTGGLGELGELLDAASFPPLELGAEPTASFAHTMDPGLLAVLCTSSNPEATEEAASFACPDGLPVQVRLRVKTDKDEVFAVRTLYLGLGPSSGPNHIPEVSGLELKHEGEWIEVTDDLSHPIPRDVSTELRARVTPAQAEEYEHGPQNAPSPRRERLTISWFVESGDTRFERTGFIEDVAPFEVLARNEWIPARKDDYSRAKAEVILVLRDDREGVSWWRHTFNLGEEP